MKILFKLFIISGIIPSTFIFILTLLAIVGIIQNFSMEALSYIPFFGLGILGYIGLLMSLFNFTDKKTILINNYFLLSGISAFVLFITFHGGIKSWIWILTIEAPKQWLVLNWPVIVTICVLIVKVKLLTTQK